MGKIISLVEYRRKRCLEALMLQIGLPNYCEECGDDIEALILTGPTTSPIVNLNAPVPFTAALPTPRRTAPALKK